MGAQLCVEQELKPAWVPHSILQVLSLFVGAVLVPNLIVCARFTALADLFRGWINVEFLLLAAVYLLLRSRLVLIAIAADLLFDLFEPVAHLYYFSDSDAYRSLRYLDAQPWTRLVLYTALILAYVFTVVLTFTLLAPRRKARLWRLSSAALCIAAILCAGDFVSGRYQGFGAEITRARLTLVRTPITSFVHRILVARLPLGNGSSGPADSAVGRLLNQSGASIFRSRANLVVVLVESWGEMRESSARDRLEQVYRRQDLQDRYSVERGTVPFKGSTISGEAREICGQVFSNGIGRASAAELRGCIPFQFLRQGYSTFGIHGFRPAMYSRQDWYPRVGFSNMFFGPDLTNAGLKTCPGGLTGTCDADVAQWLQQFLQRSTDMHPAFIHWVTLNSHLPVEPDSSHARRSSCAMISSILQDDGLCAWYSLVKTVHESVYRIAMASPRPTYFVVVGDHAPPFFSTGRRKEFSQTEVPYLLLLPRTVSENPSRQRN